MKTLRKQIVGVVTIFLLLFIVTNLNVLAQPNPISNITKSEYALDNLKSGINSENIGVRKSSVYFAGKYRIAEAVSYLVERLKKENEASVRLQIAYSLYEIKDAEGMKAVKELSLKDNKVKVKRMSFNFYEEYLSKSHTTAAI
jgi:hypothetical protein